MYICHCNPFSDRDVKELLKDKEDRASVSKVYRHCSGGNSPQCCTCLPTLKAMVRDHNGRVAVGEISKNLPQPAPVAGKTAAEPAPAAGKKLPNETVG